VPPRTASAEQTGFGRAACRLPCTGLRIAAGTESGLAHSIDDLPGLLALLTEAAHEAGQLALESFREGGRTTAAVHNKLGGSPVTDADYAVDRLLHRRLTGALPQAGWLSEETADSPERLSRRDVLVIDPIDGTRAFASGLRTWAVSVAVVSGERPIVGVVYAPALDKTYAATADAPATCNGHPITTGSRVQLEGARVAGPQNFVGPIAARGGLTFVEKVPSLACRFAFLAEGRFDVAIASANAHDWDMAAVDLILHQAGGRLTDGNGSPLAYNRAVPRHRPLFGANPELHPQLLALLEPSHR
jgi:myo-inositol-1(or 4)-monophosphatase